MGPPGLSRLRFLGSGTASVELQVKQLARVFDSRCCRRACFFSSSSGHAEGKRVSWYEKGGAVPQQFGQERGAEYQLDATARDGKGREARSQTYSDPCT